MDIFQDHFTQKLPVEDKISQTNDYYQEKESIFVLF
jgi:hypothetical protein